MKTTNSEELQFALTYNTTCFIKMLPPNPTQRPFDAFVVAGKECYSWQEAVRAANEFCLNNAQNEEAQKCLLCPFAALGGFLSQDEEEVQHD
jgi:hypothetical protein